MTCPDALFKLIERFDYHRYSYIHSKETYNETKLRQDYLDHVFIALGWDVYNSQGWSEQAREVSVEQPIKIKGTTDFIDYSFKIGKDLKFIAEAKAPKVRIKDNINAAYQVRRYAWNAKQALCILTNFDEFAVYDCTKKPSSSDAPAVARIEYFTYKEYPEKWDWIASIFSKDAVFRGSFDRFADSTKGKKGTANVDHEFLTEIENWREALARNLALRNTSLPVGELNYSVQAIIDRIIFLRICEDRGLEKYETLKSLLEIENVYAHLCELFKRADTKYNSGIFYFEKETDREEPDTITLSLQVDDKTIKDIIKRLYYPESPYEFSIIPPSILGHVYEQFLGKVIRLTPTHRAEVDFKPEVKKAGGVYYTPEYIVDYIVRHTVGELVNNKTPREVAKIHILDPACGSGSFLIGAYQFLLDWHLEWYTKNLAPLLNAGIPITDSRVQDLMPNQIKKGKKSTVSVELPIYNTGYSNGIKFSDRTRSDWALTTTEKKRILLNNIFGVDIDHQAVEVTKLSLLLKVLEGENEENIEKQLKLFDERALPNLDKNIKCGNSLIGTEIITPEMTHDELMLINPFDWGGSSGFADIMSSGGFDAVIGNPPYILVQILNQTIIFEYLAQHYQSAKYKIDTYHIFLERGLRISKPNGYLGYITPNSFLNNKHALELRRFILDNSNIKLLRIFFYKVFDKASVDTSIIVLNRDRHPNPDNLINIIFSNSINDSIDKGVQSQKKWVSEKYLNFVLTTSISADDLIEKIRWTSIPLGAFADAYFGIQTFDRTKYVANSNIFKISKPVIDGENISRYYLSPNKEFIDFQPSSIKSGGKQEIYEKIRIGVRQIGESPIASILPAGIYTLNTIYNIYFTKKVDYSIYFILGIISSKLTRWYWKQAFFDQKMTFPKIKKIPLLSIPIISINFSNSADIARHDKMVTLVTQMLELNNKLRETKLEHEKTVLRRQIEAKDKAIDMLVYELYELTDNEREIVEKS